MWPNIGPIKTYGVFYLAGIVLHFVIGWRIAGGLGLRRRVWIAAGICYLFGMLVGAKMLFDLRHGVLDLSALFRAEHWLQGGLWGGLLAYFALAVPAVLLLRPPLLVSRGRQLLPFQPDGAQRNAVIRVFFLLHWFSPALVHADAMINWIDQPSLVPFLSHLREDQRQAFRDRVVDQMLQETRQEDGRCFETFRRINVFARKHA